MSTMNYPPELTTRTIFCTVPNMLPVAEALVEWMRRELEHGHIGSGKNQLGQPAWECPAALLQQVKDAAMLVQLQPTTSCVRQLLQVPGGTQAAALVQEWMVDVLMTQMPLPRGYLGAQRLVEHLEGMLGE